MSEDIFCWYGVRTKVSEEHARSIFRAVYSSLIFLNLEASRLSEKVASIFSTRAFMYQKKKERKVFVRRT